MKFFKVYDGSNELFNVKGSRNLQKELSELWVYKILTNHNFIIEDCNTKKKYLYYGLKTLYLKNPNTFPAG